MVKEVNYIYFVPILDAFKNLLGNLEEDVSHALEVFARPVGLANEPLHALWTRPHPILSPSATRMTDSII